MPSTEDTAKQKSAFGLEFAKFLASKYGNISGPETLSPTFDSMVSSWGRPTTPIGFKYPPITPPGKPSGEGFDFSGFEGEGGGKNFVPIVIPPFRGSNRGEQSRAGRGNQPPAQTRINFPRNVPRLEDFNRIPPPIMRPQPGEPVEPVEPKPEEKVETNLETGEGAEIPDESGVITDPSMIPEWLIIAAAGAGIAWPVLVELSRGKTPEEVVEIILTYPGAGGDPNATDDRGGGGAGHRGGAGGNPMPGPYGTGPFSQTPLSSLRGDASFGHPSQMSGFGGGAGGLYEQMGPGIWDLPSSFMTGFGKNTNTGGYQGQYSR